ncbi:hypothetical protein [Actinomycetospora sp. CA-053990]|uniref:hypothetical protein n=1 Tax=Actinomycetospora sp. CA-053990 TaxID=3239891 RepID=UPI003D89EEDD
MSPAGVRSGTQCVLDGLVTVVLRALVWSLGLAAGALVLWFASNVLAPIPATAATREVALTANATPLVATGPPNPKPAGVVSGGSDSSNSAPAANGADTTGGGSDASNSAPAASDDSGGTTDSANSAPAAQDDSGSDSSSSESSDSGGDSGGEEAAASDDSSGDDSSSDDSASSDDSGGEEAAASDDSSSDDSGGEEAAASDDSSGDDSSGDDSASSDDSGGEEAAASDDSGSDDTAEADDSGDDQPQATVSDGSNNNDGDPTNDDTTADGGSVPAGGESSDTENGDAGTDEATGDDDSAEAADSAEADTADQQENAAVSDGSNNNDGDPANDDTTADGGSVSAGGESTDAETADAETDEATAGDDSGDSSEADDSAEADTADPENATVSDGSNNNDGDPANDDTTADGGSVPAGGESSDNDDTTAGEDADIREAGDSGGTDTDDQQNAAVTDGSNNNDGDPTNDDTTADGGSVPAGGESSDAEAADAGTDETAAGDDAPAGDDASGHDAGDASETDTNDQQNAAVTDGSNNNDGDPANDDSTADGGSVPGGGEPEATQDDANAIADHEGADGTRPATTEDDSAGSASATAADRGLDTGRSGDDGEISPGAGQADAGPDYTDTEGDGDRAADPTDADQHSDENADAHPINGPPNQDAEHQTALAVSDNNNDGDPTNDDTTPDGGSVDTGGIPAALRDDQPQGTPADTAEQAGLYTPQTLDDDALTDTATGDDGNSTPADTRTATGQGDAATEDPATGDATSGDAEVGGADEGLGPNGEPWDEKYVPDPDAGTGEPLPNGNGEVIGVNSRGDRIVEYEGAGRGTVDNSGASNDIVGIEGNSADEVPADVQQRVADYQNGVTRPDPDDPADPNTPADSGCSASSGVTSCSASVTGPDGEEQTDQTVGGTLITGDPEPAQVDVPVVGTAQCDAGANSCSSAAHGATAESGGRDEHDNAITLDPTSGAVEPRYSGDGRATDAEGRVVDTNDGGQVDHLDDLGPGGPVVAAGGGTGEITDSRGSTAQVHGTNEDGTGGSSTLTEGAANGATTFATDGPDWGVTTPVGDRQDAIAGARATDAEVRLRGPNGEAARVDCQDCRAQFAEGEGGNAPNGRLDAQSRDADGARARVDTTGRDSEVHDATGRHYENRTEDAGRLALVGTDAEGWGGNATCVGDCWATDRTGATVHAGTADVTDPMNPTNEDGTPRREHQMGTINHRFATGADDGGEWTAGNLWSETSSTVPEGGSVSYRPTHGGGGSFTQFFPDTVDRGGAACNFGSGGNCSGASADGQHRVSISGPTTMDPPPGVEADQRGVRLSYDGGWSTSELGVGSDQSNDAPDAERMPWLAVPDDAVTGLDDQYTHGAERPVDTRDGQVAGQSDSGLPALTVNGPWFEGARDSLGMSTLRSQVGEQQSATAVGPQFDGVERQMLDGLADGTLSPDERRGIVDGVGAIEEQNPGVIDRWGDDRGLVDTMTAYQQAQPEYAQYLAGRSPEVTWQALGVPEGDPRRAQAPTGDDVRAAADAIVAQQRGVIDTRTRLADLADSPQSQDLARRTGEFEDQLAAAQQDGVTQAEADALNAARDGILTDAVPLDAQQRDLLAQVRDQQGDLRDLDMALATTSGLAGVDTIPDPAYAAGLALPGGTLDLVDHLQDGLPAPADAESAEYQTALGDISRIADLQYRGAVDDDRDILSPLGAARLPSTTVPDVPGAMRLGVTVDEELGRPTGALTDDYYRRLLDPTTAQQRPTPDQAQVDHDPNSLMRLAAAAGPDPYGATYDPSGVRDAADRLVLSDPGGVLAAHYATQVDQDPTGRRGAAGTWFDQSWLKPDDWDAWTAQLDEQGQDGLADVQDRANKPFWDAVAGRISDSQNRANGIDPTEARVNPGANEAVAQGLVAFPKLAESLWTEVGYVPSGLGAPDWMLTEETVRAREQGLPASEVRPFSDGMIHMVQGTSGRVTGLVSGAWDAASRGYVGDQLDADGNVVVDLVSGRPVQANPWMTAMEDLGTASLVTGPVGGAMGRGAAGLSTRAGAFTEEASALRAGLRDTPDADVVLDGRTYKPAEARQRADALDVMARNYTGYAAGMSRDARIVNGVTQAGAAPILLWTRGGRVLADAAGRGVQAGGDALIRAGDRRAPVAEDGNVTRPGSATTLDRAGRGLGRAGQTLRDIGEGGALQPVRWRDQTARDRDLLGLERTADTEGIARAHAEWQGAHPRPERGPDESAADHAWNESRARAESGEATRAAGRLIDRRTRTRAEGVPARDGERGADTSPDASPTTPDEPVTPQAPDGPDGIPPTPGEPAAPQRERGRRRSRGGAHGAAADTPGGATGGRPDGDGGSRPTARASTSRGRTGRGPAARTRRS